jgi:hypothetical protein
LKNGHCLNSGDRLFGSPLNLIAVLFRPHWSAELSKSVSSSTKWKQPFGQSRAIRHLCFKILEALKSKRTYQYIWWLFLTHRFPLLDSCCSNQSTLLYRASYHTLRNSIFNPIDLKTTSHMQWSKKLHTLRIRKIENCIILLNILDESAYEHFCSCRNLVHRTQLVGSFWGHRGEIVQSKWTINWDWNRYGRWGTATGVLDLGFSTSGNHSTVLYGGIDEVIHICSRRKNSLAFFVDSWFSRTLKFFLLYK